MPEPESKTFTSHDLGDSRGIELIEVNGEMVYRVCSEGGGVCRYAKDLTTANDFADQMRPERQHRPG